MEEKNGFNSGYGIIIITLIVIIGFVVGFFVISGLSRNDNNNGNSSNNSNNSINNNSNNNGSISNDDVIDDSTKSKISVVVEEYYNEIFISHSSKYCGEVDFDAVSDVIYFKNKQFDSIDAIASYYGSIVSKKYFDNNLRDKFVEAGGNLYCNMFKGASLEYEKNSFIISSIKKSNDNIIVQGTYKTLESDLNPSESFNALIYLINENGSWVIDSYEEVK